jgi:hypothetical protein
MTIEEGRGLCEYQSPQKVTKKGAGSNQLRDVGKERGSGGGGGGGEQKKFFNLRTKKIDF